MDNTELIKSDLRLRIRQIEHIRQKVQRIDRYREFPHIRLYADRLERVRKEYESRFTPAGWAGIASVALNDKLTRSILSTYRLNSFIYEVRFESMAVNYDSRFFGFYHPEPFTLFGLSTDTVFNFGMISGGYRDEGYGKLMIAVKEDPSIIQREREKVTAYLYRGFESTVSKRHGKPFPIDLTIPGGY